MGWFPYTCSACCHTHKMKRLFIFILCLLPIDSFAAFVYAKAQFFYSAADGNQFFSSREQACKNYADRVVTQSGNVISSTISFNGGVVSGGGICNVTYSPFTGGANTVSKVGVSVFHSCPNTSYALGPVTVDPFARQCTINSCPAGTSLNSTTNQCDDICLSVKGQKGSFSINNSSIDVPPSVCMPNNCAATLSNSALARDKATGLYNGYGEAIYTGVTCNGQTPSAAFSNPSSSQPPPADTPEATCLKNGQSYGVVNGVAVCVPKTSTGANPVKDSSTSTTNTTNTDTSGNQTNSSSTEVKNVTQDGDQVTSTTTKNNPDGTKSESTTTQTYDDFCAANPNNKICKKASEDDTASACEDNPDLPQCFDRGDADDGYVISETTKTVTFTPKTITSAAACPANKSVSLFGHTSTIDYTPVCTYAADFRPFVIAFAYLSAAMFLFWGYKGAQA